MLEIVLQPKQEQLLNVIRDGQYGWIGMGGSRGGAKSGALRRAALLFILEFPRLNVVLFRKTLKDITDNHINPTFDELPELRKFYHVQNQTITMPHQDGDSRLTFVYEENESDFLNKFQGKNYDLIFVDEATHLTERQLRWLKLCNRSVSDVIGRKGKLVLSMNPGGISHGFIKRIFIDKKYRDNELPSEYYFLQANGWDNVEWVKGYLQENNVTVNQYYNEWTDDQRFQCFITQSDYGRTLYALPEKDRKAQLYGDWYVFAGQFFSMWDEDNIIRNRTNKDPKQNHAIDPPENSKVLAGLDYGERTVLEVAYRDCEGDIIFFAESYTTKKTPSERANAIADLLIERKLFKLWITYDTNMEISLKNYVGAEKAPIQIFREVFKERMGENAPRMFVVSKKSIDNKRYRVARNEFFKDYLNINKLKFTEDCPHAIATIPELIYDTRDSDGLDFDDKAGIDDPYDSASYCCMALAKPNPERPRIVVPEHYAMYDNVSTTEPYDWRNP